MALLFPSSSSSSLVILNLFQDNKRRLFVMLNQVQHDDGLRQDNKRRLPVMLKQVQHNDTGLGGDVQKTTFLQITISVIRVASCRRRSRTLVGMMGTLAGQPVGTVGAIGCVLQPEKGPVASSSEQRKHGWVWRETVLSVRTAFGGYEPYPRWTACQPAKAARGQ